MTGLPFRQVHLDFHTSELIGDIGGKFDKAYFQEMLKLGCVESINIFAKCHHGWAYCETSANERHPHLKFDLLGEMIDACHEIGVKCPVYISAGLDEKFARRHPEWLIRNADGTILGAPDFMTAGYHHFCMRTPYLDVLKAQVEEVVRNYDGDGIWLDIVGERVCYCNTCIQAARDKGLDPYKVSDMEELGRDTFRLYYTTINDAIHAIKPDMPVFHNSGHIKRGRHDLEQINSHLEIESLPTGGWGYDHFPLSARYVQNSNMDYLGMTGKFHTMWGEFGGFKHANALRYEMSLCLATGAKCSIGDQMHPLGKLDRTTYSLIGTAFGEVAKKQAFCSDTVNVADIAFISTEAAVSSGLVSSDVTDEEVKNADMGALRVLQEGQYLFDVIDDAADFSKYKLIVLPDILRADGKFAQKLTDYIKSGGHVLLTGDSGLTQDGTQFGIDTGVNYVGSDEYLPSYCRPLFDLKSFSSSAFVMYTRANRIELSSEATEVLAYNENSYFNRDAFHFCSHQHAPNNPDADFAGITRHGGVIYCAWKLFSDYAVMGELAAKELLLHLVDLLAGDRRVSVKLPVPGIITLRHQPGTGRDILHLLYATPLKRGNVEVIEDIPTLSGIAVTMKTGKKVSTVFSAEDGISVPFVQDGDTLSFTVDGLNCHKMLVIE